MAAGLRHAVSLTGIFSSLCIQFAYFNFSPLPPGSASKQKLQLLFNGLPAYMMLLIDNDSESVCCLQATLGYYG